MAEKNKNSLTEAVEKGSDAANAIRGAIKTGKAISNVSKGAAAGGPYGAVAGAVWANRKHIGKIISAVVIILLLPVLFLLMLPSLLFGGLTDAFSTREMPILNDNTIVAENINNITFMINSVLAEGVENVVTRINADFAASNGDQIEIINPYQENIYSNINLFVAQYCAAKNKDFANISPYDMQKILRDNLNHLYSYTKNAEVRKYTSIDLLTGEETTISEIWIIYTIIYNGESHFADNIFHLNDEQKSLTYDYATNMSLFLGDGMLQFASEFNTGVSYSGVKFSDGQTEVTYFNQTDERFASQPYGTDHIGGYGCGPTSMAIVVSSLTSNTIDPIQMSKWAYENGYWCSKSGSYHSLIPGAAKAWNLTVEGCTATEPQKIIDALSSGKLVVAIMKKGHFTTSGHFIVLRGVTSEGKILVADPASYARSENEWDLSIFLNEASKYAGAGGPFWIIGTKK